MTWLTSEILVHQFNLRYREYKKKFACLSFTTQHDNNKYALALSLSGVDINL